MQRTTSTNETYFNTVNMIFDFDITPTIFRVFGYSLLITYSIRAFRLPPFLKMEVTELPFTCSFLAVIRLTRDNLSLCLRTTAWNILFFCHISVNWPCLRIFSAAHTALRSVCQAASCRTRQCPSRILSRNRRDCPVPLPLRHRSAMIVNLSFYDGFDFYRQYRQFQTVRLRLVLFCVQRPVQPVGLTFRPCLRKPPRRLGVRCLEAHLACLAAYFQGEEISAHFE